VDKGSEAIETAGFLVPLENQNELDQKNRGIGLIIFVT
jgi:hypothetical protein